MSDYEIGEITKVIVEVREHLVNAADLMDSIAPQTMVDKKIALITDLSVNGVSIRVDMIGDTGYIRDRLSKLLTKTVELENEDDNNQN